MPDYTHISVILDRSSSMESIRDDTIGGFNTFLDYQQAVPGRATLTLVQFDSVNPYEVFHHFQSLETIPKLTRETFVPRRGTPLLDAMGRGINDLENSLARMPPNGKIVMVIITDGQENCSQEFGKRQIQQMIREKQGCDWQFVFLSSDLAAIEDAQASGIHHDSSLSYIESSVGVSSAWASVSSSIAEYRASRSEIVSFSDSDRAQQGIETSIARTARRMSAVDGASGQPEPKPYAPAMAWTECLASGLSGDHPPKELGESKFGSEGEVSLVAFTAEQGASLMHLRRFRLVLVNRTQAEAAFTACDARLPIVCEAREAGGDWRPIECLSVSPNGKDPHCVGLPSNHYWDFTVPAYAVAFPSRLRFHLQSHPPIYSNEFDGNIHLGGGHDPQ